MAQTNVLVWCGQYIKGQTRQGQLKGNMRVKILNSLVKKNIKSAKNEQLKDGASFWYCAYVLRISGQGPVSRKSR